MKILITGAGGFIGQWLLQALPPDVAILAHLGKRPVYSTLKVPCVFQSHGNLAGKNGERCLPSQSVDCVVHLAGKLYGEEKNLISANIHSTQTVVKWAKTIGCKRIILASTAAIYGNTCFNLAHEKFSIDPQTPYARSKAESEKELMLLNSDFDIDVISLRIPHVYGPLKKIGVFANMLHQLTKQDTVELDGNGEQKRDFIYISDVVSALINCIHSPLLNNFDILNIGSGTPLKLNAAATIMGKVIGVEPKIKYTGRPAGSPHCIQISIQKAKKQLAPWHPNVFFDQGVSRCLSHVGH